MSGIIGAIMFVAIISWMLYFAMKKTYNEKEKPILPKGDVTNEPAGQTNTPDHDVILQEYVNQHSESSLTLIGSLLIICGIVIFIWGLAYDVIIKDSDFINIGRTTDKLMIAISGSLAIISGILMACTGAILDRINKNMNK